MELLYLPIFCIFLLGLHKAQSADSFPLTDRQHIAYACDYSTPITAVNLANSSIPCSALYTPVLDASGLGTKLVADTILDVNKLSTIVGTHCFKLTLVTRCTYRFWTANEIERFTQTEYSTRDECLGAGTCVGCEVANMYPPEDCPALSSGFQDVKRTVIFTRSVVVYSNQLRQYTFNGITAYENYFLLGGQYGSKVFFTPDPAQLTQISSETYFASADRCLLVSTSAKRLLTCSGSDVELDGVIWKAYGDTFIRKDHIFKTTRLLQTTPGQQSYFEFYTNAQLNVTNFKLEYLDCRIKNALLSLQKIVPQSNLLFDLGPGERYEDGHLRKYRCYAISVGELRSKDSCMRLKLDDTWLQMLPNGEARENWDGCTSSLRLNRSHVLNVNSTGSFTIAEYSYPSLQDEESILNYPPEVSANINELRELIKKSTVYDSTQVKSQSTTTQAEFKQLSLMWLRDFMSSGAWLVITFIIQLVSFLVLAAAGGYFILTFGVPFIRALFWKSRNETRVELVSGRNTFDLDQTR